MSSANMPITMAPAILLVEPGASEYSERAGQLAKTAYCVVRAEGSRDIFCMLPVSTYSVAVLSNRIGFTALRASAQAVRGHWPKARILLLGRASARFEDQLYDEALDHTASEAELLATVHTLSEEYWARRGESFAIWASSFSPVARQANTWPESDPSKASPTPFLTEDTRSWANSVRRFHGPRLG